MAEVATAPSATLRSDSGNSFGRDARLLRPQEFAEVFAQRRVLRSKHFAAHYRTGPAVGQTTRLGLVIPKKNAHDAVLRNALKRQIRETFRQRRAKSMLPVELVIRLAQPIDRPDYRLDKASKAAWRSEIETLFDKLQQTLHGKSL